MAARRGYAVSPPEPKHTLLRVRQLIHGWQQASKSENRTSTRRQAGAREQGLQPTHQKVGKEAERAPTGNAHARRVVTWMEGAGDAFQRAASLLRDNLNGRSLPPTPCRSHPPVPALPPQYPAPGAHRPPASNDATARVGDLATSATAFEGQVQYPSAKK